MSDQVETYPDAPPPALLIAVCHTPGCPSEGVECVNAYYPYGDYNPPRYMGQCGRCQQPIIDLRPAPDPDPSQDDPTPPPPIPIEPSGP